jgi:hypothetical protein
MSASLDEILCQTQRAEAVLDMLLESHEKWIDSDTALYSLFSVQAEIKRMIKQLDGLFEKDHRLAEKLLAMGIFEEVMRDTKDNEVVTSENNG